VSDEWSLKICFQELTELYSAAARAGAEPSRASHSNTLIIQRGSVNAQGRHVLEEQLAFWRNNSGSSAGFRMPTDHPRPAMQTFRGTIGAGFAAGTGRVIDTMVARHGATCSWVTLAAVQGVDESATTQQEDVVIGSPIGGGMNGDRKLIGFFVKHTAAGAPMSPVNPTSKSFSGVSVKHAERLPHEDLPFEKVVEKIAPGTGGDTNAITRVCSPFQKQHPAGIEVAES